MYHVGSLIGLSDKFDPYAGLILANNWMTVKEEQLRGNVDLNPTLDPYPEGSGTLGVFIGMRYFLNDKMALMGELGHSTSLLKLGISTKL